LLFFLLGQVRIGMKQELPGWHPPSFEERIDWIALPRSQGRFLLEENECLFRRLR
jgi:hypothetical protein